MQPPDPLTESDLLRFTMEQRRRRPHPTRADHSRPEPTKQPPDPLTESDLLRFTVEQRRRRPHPTRADQATTRLSNGVTSTAIYNGTASPAPTPDQSRPEPTKQPPDPLTESDRLRFTMEQRRRRPHPTRADQATTRPSNGVRSTAICSGTASPAPTPDQSRPEPTKQPPDPLTDPNLLVCCLDVCCLDVCDLCVCDLCVVISVWSDQRWNSVAGDQSRPEPTKADQSRPSNHQTL